MCLFFVGGRFRLPEFGKTEYGRVFGYLRTNSRNAMQPAESETDYLHMCMFVHVCPAYFELSPKHRVTLSTYKENYFINEVHSIDIYYSGQSA